MKTTKKRTIAISVLAVLLIALLAFNVTYAYFTDKITTDVSLDFGIVDINATGVAISMTNATAMPGDQFNLAGTLSTANATTSMWVYFSIPTESVTLTYLNTADDGTDDEEITTATVNEYFDDDDPDTTTYTYTTDDITAMKAAVVAAVQESLVTYINGLNNSTPGAWALDSTTVAGTSLKGMTSAAVAKNSTLNLATSPAAHFTLTASSFGNLFQNVKIGFSIVILAIQSDNVTKAQAMAAFTGANSSTIDFESGLGTIITA